MEVSPAPTPTGGGFLPPGSMDFSTTGVPLLDFVIDGLVVAGIVGVGAYSFYALHLKPVLAKIAQNAATAADQTANSHAGAEYPNLRDNLDAVLTEVRSQSITQAQLQQTLEELREGQRRQDRELARIQEAQASDRQETRRVRESLDEHISEKRDVRPRLERLERQAEACYENTRQTP